MLDKQIKILIVLYLMLIVGCSASFIVNKGDNNVIETKIDTTPNTSIELDSINVLSDKKNKNNK